MHKKKLLLIFIILIGVIVYGNSLKGALFCDDEATVTNNVFITNPVKYLPQIFTAPYYNGWGETHNSYRPLTTLSFSLDYRIWKLNPVGYHLFNVILHILNSIIIFLILNRLFLNYKLSFISALLFLIHPVNTQTVNYVSNRPDLLMLFFFLAAFYSYLLYRQKGKLHFLALACILYICSILSKEAGLVLWVFVLIYELIFFNPSAETSGFKSGDECDVASGGSPNLDKGGSTQKRKIFPLLGFMIIFLAYLTLHATSFYLPKINLFIQGAQGVPYSQDLLFRLLAFPNICLHYLKLFFLPLGLHMEYAAPAVKSFLDPGSWLALISLVSLAAIIFYLGRRKREVIFGGLWFIAGLIPVSGLIPLNRAMSEHYLYLASAGFFILISCAALSIWKKAPSFLKFLLFILGLAILIALCILTFSRNRIWQDPLKIYFEIIEKEKYSFRGYNNIGVESLRRGNLKLAEKYLLRSLKISPAYAPALNSLGVVYEKKANLLQAESFFLRTVVLDPYYLPAQQNLANIYLKDGRVDEAMGLLDSMLKLYPYDGKTLSLLKQAQQAVKTKNP